MEEQAGNSFSLILSGAGDVSPGRAETYGGVGWKKARLWPLSIRLYAPPCGTRGFLLEAREYLPHLTLGRQVRMQPSFDGEAFAASIPAAAMEVKAVSLMQSLRVNGRLLYKCLYRTKLKDGEAT